MEWKCCKRTKGQVSAQVLLLKDTIISLLSINKVDGPVPISIISTVGSYHRFLKGGRFFLARRTSRCGENLEFCKQIQSGRNKTENLNKCIAFLELSIFHVGLWWLSG